MSTGKITVVTFPWSVSKEIIESQYKGKGRKKKKKGLRNNQNLKTLL